MRIKKAEMDDLPVVAALACRLWPAHTIEEMLDELGAVMESDDAAFFLAFYGDMAAGFAQCQLRYDYVEGTDSSPVGYLEGIYVTENARKQGIAKALLGACEGWAKSMGCTEFASDCELDNMRSLRFHLRMGFKEANRIICFTKRI